MRRILLIVVTITLISWWLKPHSFITIPEDSRGVLWERFNGGTVLERTLQPGHHLIWPFNNVYIYQITEQQRQFNITALNQQGIAQQLSCTANFTPNQAKLPNLHLHVGLDYINKIVLTELSAMIRKELAGLYHTNDTTLGASVLRQFNEQTEHSQFQFIMLKSLNCTTTP